MNKVQIYFSEIRFMEIVSRAYNFLLNIISPPFCAYCKNFIKEREIFCATCKARLQPVVSIMLPVTTTKSIKVFAACAYREPIKYLIVSKSWSNSVASKQLGELIWTMTDISSHQFDFIVPIPLHWTRFAKRGFNQAEEIAKVISGNSNKSIIHALLRIKRTKFQSAVETSGSRIFNVENAFEIRLKYASQIKGKHILLVDDLMTTGATLRSCAKILFKYKPASISVAVASRVIQ